MMWKKMFLVIIFFGAVASTALAHDNVKGTGTMKCEKPGLIAEIMSLGWANKTCYDAAGGGACALATEAANAECVKTGHDGINDRRDINCHATTSGGIVTCVCTVSCGHSSNDGDPVGTTNTTFSWNERK